MKLVSFRRNDGTSTWGVTDGVDVIDAVAATPQVPGLLIDAIQHESWPLATSVAAAALSEGRGEAVDFSRLLPPIAELRRNVFCLGPNYKDHAEESLNSPGVPDEPLYFTKATTTLAPPRHSLVHDERLTNKLDWEIELAVVIGRGGRDIPEDSALDHVLGYCVAIDFSARDLQMGRPEGQWFLGKSLDGFFPIGPWIVTTDDISDPQSLDLRLAVNGVTKQQSSTSRMLFSVARIIADLSRYVTLLPGDIISTGTPAGVGDVQRPPEYLTAGDHVIATIEHIGTVETTIVPPAFHDRATTPSNGGDIHEH